MKKKVALTDKRIMILKHLLSDQSFFTPLRERLRTHKVFTKDQCFCLNYHKFSIKSYVVGVY